MRNIKSSFYILTALAGIFPIAGQAAGIPSLTQYRQLKEDALYAINRCDLIGEQEVLSTTSIPLSELDAQSATLHTFFEDVTQKRNTCYIEAKKSLNELLTYSWQYLQVHPSHTNFKWQYELDQTLRFSIEVKATLSKELLHSMLKDIEISLTLPKADITKQFVKESTRTKRLVRETAMVNLETMRRQLFLDESTTLIGDVDVIKLAFVKLEAAQFYLAYAMLTFEDIYSETRRLFALSKLSGDIDYAVSQLSQLLHYAPYLQGLDTKHTKELITLSDTGRSLSRDIGTTLSEIQAQQFEAENEGWITHFYERTSLLSLKVKALLGNITQLRDAKLDAEQQNTQTFAKKMSDTLLEYTAIPQVSLTEIAPTEEEDPLFEADLENGAPLENAENF